MSVKPQIVINNGIISKRIKYWGILFFALFLFSVKINAQNSKSFELKSPNKAISVKINIGNTLEWSLNHKGQQIIQPSVASIVLSNGSVLGENAIIKTSKQINVNEKFNTINYKKAVVEDYYNQLTINFKGNYGIIFRLYNDAVAYRFFTAMNGELCVKNEQVNYNFADDHVAYIPFAWDYRTEERYCSSFEAMYTKINISKINNDSLAMLPTMVDLGNGKKIVLLEADLEDYPGMYLNQNYTTKGLKGVFAPYPTEFALGGYEDMNYLPTQRADFIAKTNGKRDFPWRVAVISESDKEMLNQDIIQKLASPSRIEDVSWIVPGQVSWDWWNDWNISGVDFEAGMNTKTYLHYIDFASENRAKYIIIDWEWSELLDLTARNPAVDLEAIVDYGKTKNVGVIIWASWRAIVMQMDSVFPMYADMGIKGFKIDFIDRDDQIAIASTYEIAEKAAEYKLLIDYHGVSKPTGLQRTYPNVIGYEGVRGLENSKWATDDAPKYAVSMPYLRMMAGPVDYTPGAMRNAAKHCYAPINSNPMSQGTRCHQMAMYVVYEVPLQMLSDNPTIYRKEQECTDFIIRTPTIYDETVALDGQFSEYLALARKKDDTWFLAAMTNWDARSLTIDLSFLDEGEYNAVIFKDGVNAHRDGTDYKKEIIKVNATTELKVQLYPGGGYVARISKI